MSLVAAELERAGVATVVIQLLREVAMKVGPPRALWVPCRHGYPLGEPGHAEQQRAILRACLRMFEEPGPPPTLRDFECGGRVG